MLRSAFTLVELLVVMAIIVLLTGAIIGGLASARGAAKDRECESLLSRVGSAIELYKGELRHYPPRLPDAVVFESNNLAYCLNSPASRIPQGQDEMEYARWSSGFARGYLWGELDQRYYDHSAVDMNTVTPSAAMVNPSPIFDNFDDLGKGRALIYIYHIHEGNPARGSGLQPTARETVTAGQAPSHNVLTHAYEGYERSYELWSAGADGLIDAGGRLHDLELPENRDNLTVKEYR